MNSKAYDEHVLFGPKTNSERVDGIKPYTYEIKDNETEHPTKEDIDLKYI